MKRSAFLASLLGFLGISQAQQWREDEPERRLDPLNCMGWDKEGNVARVACGHSGKHKPALNNQCPVCGTMAKPYSGKRAYELPFCEGAQQFPPPPGACDELPRQRITRCLRCTAAFWQDSEDKK